MILTSEQIADLFAGRVIDHYEPVRRHHKQVLKDGSEILARPWSRTRSYAAQLPGKKASCQVLVLACVHDSTTDRWFLSLKIERVQQEPARLLKRGVITQTSAPEESSRAHGYTDRPSEALKAEPEAVDAETLDKYSKQAQERHSAFLDALEERPLLEQLAYELRRAEEVGVDARHVHSALQRRIRALRRQIDQRAA
jgi:hypothetical protein